MAGRDQHWDCVDGNQVAKWNGFFFPPPHPLGHHVHVAVVGHSIAWNVDNETMVHWDPGPRAGDLSRAPDSDMWNSFDGFHVGTSRAPVWANCNHQCGV